MQADIMVTFGTLLNLKETADDKVLQQITSLRTTRKNRNCEDGNKAISCFNPWRSYCGCNRVFCSDQRFERFYFYILHNFSKMPISLVARTLGTLDRNRLKKLLSTLSKRASSRANRSLYINIGSGTILSVDDLNMENVRYTYTI